MKISTPQKTKTGIFVAVTAGLLLVAIFVIGKQQSLFGSTFTVHANFKNVSGLQVGNYIRFAGINAGNVDNIVIVNDTTVRVDLRLQSKVRKYIKADAMASISSDGLMGDKLIQIAPGTPSQSLVKEDAQILSVEPPDMDKVMAKVSNVITNAESITGDLAGIVGRVNNGEGSIGRLLNSDKLASELESTVSSTRNTMQSLKKGADGFSDNMEATKNSILFRGYFKKKEKERIKDSIANAKKAQQAVPKKKN